MVRATGQYNISKTIPLTQLVRAYELLSCTDMNYREVARAIGIKDARTLSHTIKIAERQGLHSESFKPRTTGRMILAYLNARKEQKITVTQIAEGLGLNYGTVRNTMQHLYKRKAVTRRKLGKSTNGLPLYGYFTKEEKS